MKILFVENRYKTKFWEILAKQLRNDGHTICWVVQNHLFKPTHIDDTIITIPYFKGQYKKGKIYTPEINKIIKSNRGLNYFNIQSDDFLFYYQDEICDAIDFLKPDIAFGESTLFHELLIINACKKREILYLHPSTCRYPAGRFSFYLYDTLEPYKGSGEHLNDAETTFIIDQIIHRNVVPDYMKMIKPRIKTSSKFLDKIRLSYSYISGERFNTPAPWIKWQMEKKKEKLITEWDIIAQQYVTEDNRFKILYPLQIQPEANIDVWGYPNNNQLDIIKQIVSLLSPNHILYIKPNPKSKYELTEELISYVKENNEKVKVLAHCVAMKNVFPLIDFVITVTGTISYECIWSQKPFIMLGQGLSQIYAIGDIINSACFEKKTLMSGKNGALLLNKLVATSYKGIIRDSFNDDLLNDTENINYVSLAFNDIIENTKKKC